MKTEKMPWHALYVHSRAEKKVYERLVEMGLEAYLPLITKMKRWSDRMKKVEEPLFKSYLLSVPTRRSITKSSPYQVSPNL